MMMTMVMTTTYPVLPYPIEAIHCHRKVTGRSIGEAEAVLACHCYHISMKSQRCFVAYSKNCREATYILPECHYRRTPLLTMLMFFCSSILLSDIKVSCCYCRCCCSSWIQPRKFVFCLQHTVSTELLLLLLTTFCYSNREYHRCCCYLWLGNCPLRETTCFAGGVTVSRYEYFFPSGIWLLLVTCNN